MQYQLKTAGQYPLDEVVSALQKSIRRGMEKEAMYWALELDNGFSSYLWRRLVVIVCEDIGTANPQLVATVCALRNLVEDLRKLSKDKSYDPDIMAFAVLAMVRSKKSREADDYLNEVMRERRTGAMHLEIPDYAVDEHTDRGRAMHRGPVHFWTEGAQLENEDHPSAYLGFDPVLGDGWESPKGVQFPTPPKPLGPNDPLQDRLL